MYLKFIVWKKVYCKSFFSVRGTCDAHTDGAYLQNIYAQYFINIYNIINIMTLMWNQIIFIYI